MVECQLPKLEVASSSLVARFINKRDKNFEKIVSGMQRKIAIVYLALFAHIEERSQEILDSRKEYSKSA